LKNSELDQKESKDIKGGIRGRNSRTDRQYNNKKRVKISKVESEAVIQVWADNTGQSLPMAI
jgi:hypothetical protein